MREFECEFFSVRCHGVSYLIPLSGIARILQDSQSAKQSEYQTGAYPDMIILDFLEERGRTVILLKTEDKQVGIRVEEACGLEYFSKEEQHPLPELAMDSGNAFLFGAAWHSGETAPSLLLDLDEIIESAEKELTGQKEFKRTDGEERFDRLAWEEAQLKGQESMWNVSETYLPVQCGGTWYLALQKNLAVVHPIPEIIPIPSDNGRVFGICICEDILLPVFSMETAGTESRDASCLLLYTMQWNLEHPEFQAAILAEQLGEPMECSLMELLQEEKYVLDLTQL